MHCAVPFFCARSGTEGEAACRCGEWVVRLTRNTSSSLRAGVGAAWASGSAREGRVAVRGQAEVFGGEWVVRSAGVHRRCVGVRRGCVGERKCSGRACRCAWASDGLRRGMSCGVGGECIAQPAGVGRGCVGERKCSGRVCRCVGASGGLWRGMGGKVGGECIAQPAGVRRGCVGERKCSGRACRCAGG